ncbi:MAG: hypothetical protein M1814_003162 [Vezdaea aestivalis]|nr:MAG: hypothetical protein M1814_003162 [Vezdaea aestivalis]
MSNFQEAQSPPFHRQKHIKYWLRCLRTFLPTQYTSTDTARMSLAFFILSALDLLSALDSNLTLAERDAHISWIYHCQHPKGGFRGSPATIIPSEAVGEQWDPATLPSTYFALAALAILGDDLKRVKKKECLGWLRSLQGAGGGFSELMVDGEREGGNDPRVAYAAAGIRWFLRQRKREEETEDIDLFGLRSFIEGCESFDHGFGGGPDQESHAGLTYCSLGALSFLGPITPRPRTLHWLVSRQSADLPAPDSDTEDEPSFHSGRPISHTLDSSSSPFLAPGPAAGFAGRPSKVPDTCYSFWVGASLEMLGSYELIDTCRNREFLLEHTQGELTGGFAKCPGAPPDILHSFLGLAALALDKVAIKECYLKPLDPIVCISKEAVQKIGGDSAMER